MSIGEWISWLLLIESHQYHRFHYIAQYHALHSLFPSYDLGIGAGFYVDSTEEPYSKHYKMYTYVTEGDCSLCVFLYSRQNSSQRFSTQTHLSELPALLENEFFVGKDGLRAISGHSMGGHGALTIALKSPSKWTSVSAFSPICKPTACPWGDKAFTAYLGSVEAGRAHDATCLLGEVQSSPFDDILIDQGDADEFLTAKQLLPESLVEAATKSGQTLTLNMREGFDHSYFFIASFIEEHGK